MVDEGNVVLIFPEGTRSPDGVLQPFKPLVGKLSLETGVDILPMWLGNTYNVLPKGASVPRGRDVNVHIGPPLEMVHLKRLTAGLRPSEAARIVTRIAQLAVEALRDGSVLDISTMRPEELLEEAPAKKVTIDDTFKLLERKFDAARVEQPVTWYFTLTGDAGTRYTVSVRADGVEVRAGRPAGSADCVIKTSEDMITRIIRAGYIPDPAEFISGAIKVSEIPLLIEFARVFNLTETGGIA